MNNTTAARCFKETAKSPPSLFQNGNIVIQVHHVGWLLTGVFALIATITSAWLIGKHLHWYTNKREQRYIVRILFLVPIYAIISFSSYLFWNRSTPLLLLRDCYESIVLTAFFYLLLMYLSHEPEEQQRIFAKYGLSCGADREARVRGEPSRKWVFPLGFVQWKPQDGLYFLQLMKYGILQYVVIRPVTTLLAVILDYVGLYCESSWSPRWGHIYISAIVSLSVTVAMFCLVQLYVSVSTLLAPRQPLLKLFSIKAVVFLTFWQSTFLSVLSTFGVVKNTTYMTAEDIDIGIGALLETFEMTLFALLHIKAFSYLPYNPSPKGTFTQPTSRLRSLGHAMDFRETCREIWSGCVYLFDKARGREPSNDRQARRAGYYENAFSRPRPPQRTAHPREKRVLTRSPPHRTNERAASPHLPVHVEVEREVDIEGERQWLGNGDDYIYGLEFMRKERSESLETQFERELAKRGYAPTSVLPPVRRQTEPEPLNRPGRPAGRESNSSWWRNIYKRLSQSDPDAEEPPPPSPRQKSKRRRLSRSPRHSSAAEQNMPLLIHPATLDDLPPQSLLEVQQQQQQREERSYASPSTESFGDVLTPLPVFQDSRHAGLGGPNPGRSANRKSPLTMPVGQQSTVSSSVTSRPASSVEGNISHLAPTSSRASHYSRADSLLGRLFPDTTTEGDAVSMTEFGTTNDGSHSIFSMSTDRVGQARKTPRARLTTTNPQIMTRGLASRRIAAPLLQVPEQLRPAHELLGPSPTEHLSPCLPSPSGSDGRRSSRSSTSSRPLPTPPSPVRPRGLDVHDSQVPLHSEPDSPVSRTIRRHTSRDDMDIPTPRHNLRRSNAQARPRAMTGPPEPQRDSVLLPYVVPSSLPPSPAEYSPSSYGYPSNISLIATARPRNAASPPSDVSYQMHPQLRGDYFASDLRLSPPVSVMQGNHKTRDPPSPQSRADPLSSPYYQPPSPLSPHASHSSSSTNLYSAINNRLRKHQDSKHARGRASPPEMPTSTSRIPQTTHNSSRPHPNGGSYTPRTWRTVDYQSTSWYVPPANS